jgi:hypothetical protein
MILAEKGAIGINFGIDSRNIGINKLKKLKFPTDFKQKKIGQRRDLILPRNYIPVFIW